jgi:hypothetical protein
MDPQATWELILDALQRLEEDNDDTEARDDVVAALEHLLNWIRSGGMPPTVN